MANGKPHDHPLTDIFDHRIEVYGKDTDDLIRKIGNLSSRVEVDKWWQEEIGWNPNYESVLAKAQARYAQLMKRAEESGWETDK